MRWSLVSLLRCVVIVESSRGHKSKTMNVSGRMEALEFVKEELIERRSENELNVFVGLSVLYLMKP